MQIKLIFTSKVLIKTQFETEAQGIFYYKVCAVNQIYLYAFVKLFLQESIAIIII